MEVINYIFRLLKFLIYLPYIFVLLLGFNITTVLAIFLMAVLNPKKTPAPKEVLEFIEDQFKVAIENILAPLPRK